MLTFTKGARFPVFSKSGFEPIPNEGLRIFRVSEFEDLEKFMVQGLGFGCPGSRGNGDLKRRLVWVTAFVRILWGRGHIEGATGDPGHRHQWGRETLQPQPQTLMKALG